MRFQVPQFIEIEDRIFGPFTLKQFIYLAGGGGLCFMFWSFIPSFILALVFIVPVAALSLALAFYKVNNKPFISLIEAAARYLTGSKLYIWKRTYRKPDGKKPKEGGAADSALDLPKLSDSRLKDLTWSLDINQRVSTGGGGGKPGGSRR